MPLGEPRPSPATGFDTATSSPGAHDDLRSPPGAPVHPTQADLSERGARVTLGRLWDAGIGLLVVYAAIVIAFSQLSEFFLTKNNFLNILVGVSILGIVAATQTMVIISRGFDLSVGSTVALAGVVTAEILNAGGSDPLAVSGAIGVGLAVGLVNGLLITVVHVNPLITTLATLSIVRGIAYVWTDALTQSFPGPNLRWLGTGRVFWDIPVSVLIMLAVFVVVWLTLRFTTFGRSLVAVGGNPRAALLAGIDVGRVQLAAYVISGLSAGFAGAILAAQLSAGSPQAANGLELNVVAAVVLGGASLAGGRGRVWGTLLGALIMETLRNGLVLTDVSSFYQMIAWGAVLLLAVVIDQLRRGEGS
ncbi:MAG: ABC transporter permease [Chloroflexi bacterium]|nr:ABC transporter permease [Chloroflexota bacterium]